MDEYVLLDSGPLGWRLSGSAATRGPRPAARHVTAKATARPQALDCVHSYEPGRQASPGKIARSAQSRRSGGVARSFAALTMPWNRRSGSSISSRAASSASNSFSPFSRSARAEAISQRPRSLGNPAGLMSDGIAVHFGLFKRGAGHAGVEEREPNRGQRHVSEFLERDRCSSWRAGRPSPA